MEKTKGPIKILLLSQDSSVIKSTHEILEKDKTLELLEIKIHPKDVSAVLSETQPDVILFDCQFQENPLDLLNKISSKYSNSALVAILSESTSLETDLVLKSGAKALVEYPYQSGNLIGAVKKVMDSSKQNTQTQEQSAADITSKHRKILTVFSPKGGVGTTTVSINLAISLHKTTKQDVLLIDGKHLFGHVALYCNIHTGNSITDLIAHAGSLDQQLIKQVVVRHTSGIHVLPSPNSVAEAQGIRPDDLVKMMRDLQTIFPVIIIDGGNYLNENAVTYMDLSDKILLCLNSDLASMRDIKQFLDISATLSYPKDKLLLILNSIEKKSEVKAEELEGIIKLKIFGKIPADNSVASNSLNEGVPILSKKPHHPISRAFIQIANEIDKVFLHAADME